VIRVEVQVDGHGCVRQLVATGHAPRSAPAAISVACAAATCLLRTAGSTLAAEIGVTVDGAAPTPGHFRLHVTAIAADRADWVAGLTSFLVTGFRDLIRDYPGQVRMVVRTPKRSSTYGT